MKTKLNPLRKLLLLAVGVLALAALPLAHAVPTAVLQISDGLGHTVTVADQGSGDQSNSEGAVTFNGYIGNFFLNVSTGISKPLLGSQTWPLLDLSSVNVSGATGGTLTILFSDNNFGASAGGVMASIGGTSYGTVSYSTYYDASNSLLATSSLMTSQGLLGGVFSGSAYSELALTDPYSLTQKLMITHSGIGATSFNAELKVPDGGSTVALLGAVLVGLEGFRRKLRGAFKIV